MKGLINFTIAITRKYLFDSFYLALPYIVSTLVGLISIPIVVTHVSPKEFGVYQLALVIKGCLITLSGSHITGGAKRDIARGLEGTFLYAFLYRFKLLFVIGVSGVIASFFILNAGFNLMGLLLMVVCAFLALGYLFKVSYLSFFIAKKQFKKSAFWQVITTLCSMGCATAAVVLTHNIVVFAAVLFGVTSLISWIGWVYVIERNNLVLAYKQEKINTQCINYGKKLILPGFASFVANKVSYFIIPSILGFSDLAVFSVASKLRDRLVEFIKYTRQLFYSDFAKEKKEKLLSTLRSTLKYVFATAFVITLFFLIAGYLYIRLLLPPAYQAAALYFCILIFSIPPLIVMILMRLILEVNFQYRELSILTVIPNLITMLLICILGLAFQIIGICLAIVIGAWIHLGFYYYFTFKTPSFLCQTKNNEN